MNKCDQWFDDLPTHQRVIVAFSGGVDSSVVASSAKRRCGDRAIAVTARSPSVAGWQIETAVKIAAQIGIEHRFVDTAETGRDDYIRNDRRRCFYCKETLYQSLSAIAAEFADCVLVSGTNADDLGDYRPGIEAGKLAGVRSPLADLGISKAEVRRLAKQDGLSNADLPASPCLASRIAYGTEVTAARLAMVEAAEAMLRGAGFDVCRVRISVRDGERLASIEVPPAKLALLRRWMIEHAAEASIMRLGFDQVQIDPEGFRSGKLNDAPEPVTFELELAEHLR